MKNKEISEKRKGKTEKDKNWIWPVATLATAGYMAGTLAMTSYAAGTSATVGYTASTQSMMVYCSLLGLAGTGGYDGNHGWYLDYNSGLLAILSA